MKRRLGTLFLLLLAAIGYWWLFAESPREKPQEAGLLPFPAADAFEIQLTDGQRELRCQREEGLWQAPEGKAICDVSTLEGFLLTLNQLVPLMTVAEEGTALSDYGLDSPVRRIAIRRRHKQETFVVFLGERNPVGNGVYVKLPNDNRVMLVGSLLLWEFDKVMRSEFP